MAHEWSNLVWKARIGNNTHKLVLLQMADHADEHGFCWVGANHIADENECDPRHVPRLVKQLEEAGWIVTETGGGRHNTNGYWILVGRSARDVDRIKIAVDKRVADRQKQGSLVRKNTDIFEGNTDISPKETLTFPGETLTFSPGNPDISQGSDGKQPLNPKNYKKEITGRTGWSDFDLTDRSMDSAIGLWERVKAQIELETPRPNFDTWLRPTYAVGWDGDLIVVETPAEQGVARLCGSPMREQIERRLYEASGGMAGYMVRCKTAGEKL
jgi:hypothetical protein